MIFTTFLDLSDQHSILKKMEKTLDYYMRRVPKEIGMEIFQYLVPDATNFVVREYMKFDRFDEYKPRYKLVYESIPMRVLRSSDEVALSERQVRNDLGVYLSVIPKKNGKNRYYLTREVEITYCCTCGGIDKCLPHCQAFQDDYFSSKTYCSMYVGTDIKKALYDLFVFEVIP